MTSKFALVIANTEYQDASFAKLTTPGKDADEFAQTLRDLAAFDDVQVLLNEGEGKTRRSIARFFAERNRDDLLLLYFSGHGVRNELGQLFLVANDTEKNILEASGIPADFVTNAMNNSRSQRQLLILDCCNSGAFAYGSKSASAIGKSMGIATAFEGSGFGRVVLTASDATQYAWEGDKIIGNTQKSVFTHFLIEGLKGEADRDGDGRINVDELYEYTYEQVVRRTPKQTPGKWSYKQQGDILLRENLKPREVKPALLPAELLEMLSHSSSSVRRAAIQDLIGLLDGRHLGLARAAQEKLSEIAENDDSLSLRKTASDTLIAHGIAPEQLVHVETPREGRKEEKTIEKPARIPPLPALGKGDASSVTEREGVKLPDQKTSASKFNALLIGRIVGGLLSTVLCIWGGISLWNNLSVFAPQPIETDTPSSTQTSIPPTKTLIPSTETSIPPTKTFIPSTETSIPPTKTPIPATETSIPLIPTLAIGSTITGKDGMTLLYVPAGKFTMGNKAQDALAECQKILSNCQLDSFIDEEPPHDVYLDSFWIDQTEVTNAMYSKCVRDGKCNPPSFTKSNTHGSYYGNPAYENYPVIYASWDNATAYCSWAGRRLPTEAEWEKAAGWDADKQQKRIYPWGNTFIGSLLNFCDKNCNQSWADKNVDDGYADTSPVGHYLDGASFYGVLDMAGNVWEWVNDRYGKTYYQSSPPSNPLGPDSSQSRVIRGGSWRSNGVDVRSANRPTNNPTYAGFSVGIRCARSP